MGVGQWMRVLDTVAGLARPAPGAAGGLETKLAGVLVAALKEAFDRDRTRMDLERETVEAERARAERALQAELRRQAAERTFTQLKLIAVFAGGMLLVSALLAAWIGDMRTGAAAITLGASWTAGLAALGCVFAAWPTVSAWAAGTGLEEQRSLPAAVAPWLLLAALGLTGVTLLLT